MFNNAKAKEQQDRIFRKMPAGKKLRLASELTMLCLKLSHANGNYKSRKTSAQDRSNTRQA